MTKCVLCGKETKENDYCEICRTVLIALNTNYNTTQLMNMFSHVIGAKITREIMETMYDTLKCTYDAEKIKEEGKLN